MKFLASLLLLIVAVMVAVDAYVPKIPKPQPNKPNFPSFPGHGPFNPHASRFPRSPKDNGKIVFDAKKEGGKTQWNVETQQKVWGNKHGSIHVSAGAGKQPGGKPQGQVGIGGSFSWGK
ncbi:uncharacterized protein LOC100678093 [Nasonia vitripennis]|uniref:Uncharacterized protein n=2 Tax=Nasonia vitripennis TaxID=7425 RepID=A0A7M7GDJ8_NASVI|nr:uncharacterized protein LOC100678093 [Nasonia vitripennis]